MNFYAWADGYGRFKFGAKDKAGRLVLLGDMTFEWATIAFGGDVAMAVGLATFENPCRLSVAVC